MSASAPYGEKFPDHDCNVWVELNYDKKTNALRKIIEDDNHLIDGNWSAPHLLHFVVVWVSWSSNCFANVPFQQVFEDQKGNEIVEPQHILGLYATVPGYARCTVPTNYADEICMDPLSLHILGIVT